MSIAYIIPIAYCKVIGKSNAERVLFLTCRVQPSRDPDIGYNKLLLTELAPCTCTNSSSPASLLSSCFYIRSGLNRIRARTTCDIGLHSCSRSSVLALPRINFVTGHVEFQTYLRFEIEEHKSVYTFDRRGLPKIPEAIYVRV